MSETRYAWETALVRRTITARLCNVSNLPAPLSAEDTALVAEALCSEVHPDLTLMRHPGHPDPRCRVAACLACQRGATALTPVVAGIVDRARADALWAAADECCTCHTAEAPHEDWCVATGILMGLDPGRTRP